MRRTRLGIIAEILRFCRTPQLKTRVMYHTNLSWTITKEYLSTLESKGLLRIHHSPIKYMTTRKGAQFVDAWNHLTSLLHEEGSTRIERVKSLLG